MTPRLIVLFQSGFGQGLFEPTGCEMMFDDAHDRHSDTLGIVIWPPMSWRSNWCQQAAFLQRHMATGNRPDRTLLLIVAYSWGAGWGFQKLTKHLGSRGVVVDVRILVDPVFRPQYLPASLWWLSVRSLTTLGRLYIRPLVREVYYFRQFRSRPRGRECVAIDPRRTVVHPAIELECPHRQADKHSDVHALVKAEIAKLVARCER